VLIGRADIGALQTKIDPPDVVVVRKFASPALAHDAANCFRNFTSDFTTPSTIWANLQSQRSEERRALVE
jgi:hypothetical protein